MKQATILHIAIYQLISEYHNTISDDLVSN